MISLNFVGSCPKAYHPPEACCGYLGNALQKSLKTNAGRSWKHVEVIRKTRCEKTHHGDTVKHLANTLKTLAGSVSPHPLRVLSRSDARTLQMRCGYSVPWAASCLLRITFTFLRVLAMFFRLCSQQVPERWWLKGHRGTRSEVSRGSSGESHIKIGMPKWFFHITGVGPREYQDEREPFFWPTVHRRTGPRRFFYLTVRRGEPTTRNRF